MTREEKEQTGKYVLQMARLLEDGCYQQEMLLKAVHIVDEALEQEPKTGHWIEVTNGRGGHECDACHDYAPSFQNGNEYLSAFCPNCGAKMESEE